MSRTVLARSLFELWSQADNYNEFYNRLKHCPQTKLEQFCSQDHSFRIQVEAFGKKISTGKKVEKIEKLAFLDFQGSIDLKNPVNSFQLFEYYGEDTNNIPDEPYNIYFGLWIADSQKKVVSDLSLKGRKFIANTSMDTMLSLVMSNLAKVSCDDLILDPFVGSGSLLVSAAYHGGHVLGTDINYLLLHGLSKPTRVGAKKRENESILSNLKQYNLESKYIDVIVADASKSLWHQSNTLKFDAIITDPPYGIRESSEKVGSEKVNFKIPEHYISGHIPSKIKYNLCDIVKDLLDFAALHLKIGGRLVFWMPVEKNCFSKQIISHQYFNVISLSEQHLSGHHSRVLIVLERK